MKNRAESVCEEFSKKVVVTYKNEPYFYNQVAIEQKIEEIKCVVAQKHLTALIDRMEEYSFFCSGWQKDLKKQEVIVWFEPED